MRRQKYLEKHGTQCELCGAQAEFISGPVQVHHLTYERLGAELDDDLVAACEQCHRTMHGLERSTPITWIRQYIEMQLRFNINLEKLGRILVSLDRVQMPRKAS